MLKNMKISKSIVDVISQLFFGGQGYCSGKRRNISESFAKTLGKILWKFCKYNFTKTATLVGRGYADYR